MCRSSRSVLPVRSAQAEEDFSAPASTSLRGLGGWQPRRSNPGECVERKTSTQLAMRLVDDIASKQFSGAMVAAPPGPAGNPLPKAAQLCHTIFRCVPRNQRGIDVADGDASHPVGIEVGFGESLIHAGLICTTRPSALQHERNVLEGRPRPKAMRFAGVRADRKGPGHYELRTLIWCKWCPPQPC